MRGINFQPSASACMNSGLYGEGDVRPPHDHATTCYSLPSTPRTGFVPRRALDARKRRASVFGSLPPSGRAQSKAATEKPLCAARGVVNGTLLVAMPVSDGREAEFGPASHQFSVSS